MNGQLENIEITNLRKPGAGGAPPYGCNLGLAPKTLRTDKRTFTTLLIKRTQTKYMNDITPFPKHEQKLVSHKYLFSLLQ